MSRAARIGVIGVSLGREVAIHAAARSPEWRATVLEGVPGASPADMQASEPDPATFVTIAAEYGLSRVLGGSGPPASNPDQIERIGPRPLLVLSAGRSTEARANEACQRRGGATTELRNLPDASHAAALRTDPAGYEILWPATSSSSASEISTTCRTRKRLRPSRCRVDGTSA